MSVCAVLMVKNEADIVGTTVRHLLGQVDEVIVADNMSDDGTWDILDGIRHEDPRLTVRLDEEVGYWQARKMTALAIEAYERGHAWVVPCDADEIWRPTRKRQGTLADTLAGVAPDRGLVVAKVFNHYATARDPDVPDPVERMGWRIARPLNLPKVAVRLWEGVSIEPGNHSASAPPDAHTAVNDLVQVRHFPYRSPEQFVSKAMTGRAAYAATDLPRGYGLHWKEYAELVDAHGETAAHEWFNRYFRYEHPELAGKRHDPQPDRGLAQMTYDPAL